MIIHDNIHVDWRDFISCLRWFHVKTYLLGNYFIKQGPKKLRSISKGTG